MIYRIHQKRLFQITLFIICCIVLVTIGVLKFEEYHGYHENQYETLEDLILRRQRLHNFIGENELLEQEYLDEIHLPKQTKTIIFGAWRSGSTFTGDLFNSISGTFYIYEPFSAHLGLNLYYRTVDPARHIREMVNCNFTNKQHWIETISRWPFMKNNKRLERYQLLAGPLIKTESFYNKFCKASSKILMKIVKPVFTDIVEEILSDKQLNNTKTLLLVRDPRAVMNSRKTSIWCYLSSECYRADSLCEIMLKEYHTAQKMLKKYPEKISILRYEDLVTNPIEQTRKLLNFYNLPFDSEVVDFISTHTKRYSGGTFSTYRNSKAAAMRWMTDLSESRIKSIEDTCSTVMKLYSYKKFSGDVAWNSTNDFYRKPCKFCI